MSKENRDPTNIASYGGGTNSTAMLIECVKRKVPVSMILFADTGAERPHTYKYVEMFSGWLKDHGMSEIITVVNGGMYRTLEEECLKKKCLPSLAYGFRTCSQKWKIRPQDQLVGQQVWARDMWERGEKIIKLIGFDADEYHRAKDYEDAKYIAKYPLVEWGIGRDDCIDIIEKERLCLPGKSACYFCPSTKQSEIRQLKANYPDLAARALEMEANADLTQIAGLGRRFSWADLLSNKEMFGDYNSAPEMACGCYDG